MEQREEDIMSEKVPLKKIDPLFKFMDADIQLGFAEQNIAAMQSGPLQKRRQALIEYAKEHDLLWAVPDFLSRRGWLDDDWKRRLKKLGEIKTGGG